MKNLTKNINVDNGIFPRIDLFQGGGEPTITIFTEIPVDWIEINQNLTDPSQMITGDVRGDQIQWIRENSHRVLAKKTGEGQVTICRLNDQDSNQYYDGSLANLDGTEGDSFVKLPTFYYKAEEKESDIWRIGFSSQNFPDSKEWSGNTLIGTYEAYYGDNKLQSISGVGSNGNISQGEFKQLASSRGQGYIIEDWTIHCMMAFLFYAYYGNTNSQRICGAGTNSYSKKTGQTNSLGMTDTEGGVLENEQWDNSKNGNQGSINFWGLENWWGNKVEWIDGIEWKLEGGQTTATITMPSGETRKAICPSPVDTNTFNGCMLPEKFTIGEYLDLIPKDGLSQEEIEQQFSNAFLPLYDINYGFSDGCAVSDISTSQSSMILVVCRSFNNSISGGGVAFSDAGSDSSYSNPNNGSRLAFRGEVLEASSVSEFKSLPIL